MRNRWLNVLTRTSCLCLHHMHLLTTNAHVVLYTLAPAIHECLLCCDHLLTLQGLDTASDSFAHAHIQGAEHTCMCDSGQAPGSPQLPEGQNLCHHWHSGLPIPR